MSGQVAFEKKRASGCSFAIFLVVLFILSLFTLALFVTYGSLGVSIGKWMTNRDADPEIVFTKSVWTSSYMDTYKSARFEMLEDLIITHLEDGMSPQELIEFCGQPERISGDTMAYVVGFKMTVEEQQTALEFKIVFEDEKLKGVWVPTPF